MVESLVTVTRSPARRPRLHPAWIVAAVAFIALIGAAGFRAGPSVLMVPLQDEFGWSRGLLSLAVSVNLVLFGVIAPFAAALMDRFGIRAVTSSALCLIAAGSGLSVFVSAGWHLVVLWGVLIGTGTGSMALVFAATSANRWFARRRGPCHGDADRRQRAGQLIFLPVMAWMTEWSGWRAAALVIAAAALGVIPLVLRYLHNHPADRGVEPYGAVNSGADAASGEAADVAAAGRARVPAHLGVGAARRAVDALQMAARRRTFWALAGGFAICGATTNGLIGTHSVPAAHDHGMAQTTAAGLLAVVGIFDIVGTVASDALSDRVNPRIMLAIYYGLRGTGLLMLPYLLSDTLHASMIAFVVIYGLDWVATVPPTAMLCREVFGEQGTIVFGWVFASHQIGAALASVGAGIIRDVTGTYTAAWLGAAALCVVAATVSANVRRVGGATAT